jgi:hypothetical protein
MKLQTARLEKVEKQVAAMFEEASRVLVILEDPQGVYTETYTGRSVPQEELDALGEEDLLLILHTESVPPCLFLKGRGVVKTKPAPGVEEWEKDSIAVHKAQEEFRRE